MESTGTLWVEECKIVKKEPNEAEMALEDLQENTAEQPLSPRSTSKNSDASDGTIN